MAKHDKQPGRVTIDEINKTRGTDIHFDPANTTRHNGSQPHMSPDGTVPAPHYPAAA